MTIIATTQAPTPWKQSTDDPGLAFDLFPAEVFTPDASFTKVRAILTVGSSQGTPPTLYVFQDGPQGPGLVLEAIYDPRNIYGSHAKGYDVYAALDPAAPTIASVVQIRPMTGCGCGSKLRSLVPFTTMRHSAPPALVGPLPAPPVTTP